MIVCQGSSKSGHRIRRHRVAIDLAGALAELFQLYTRLGGPGPEIERALDAEIERCLGERSPGRERLQTHLHQLLRARDLNHYVQEESDLVPLKLALLENLLFHPTPVERWGAIRSLLLEQLERICRPPLPGLLGNLELYKQALSDRSGRLGRLLVTVALFNFDHDQENPPENLIIHFGRGRFPHYSWEICTSEGRLAHHGTADCWSPSNPLSRWEYLATDLAQALFRRSRERAPGAGVPRLLPAAARAHGSGDGIADADVEGAVYCRFEADAGAAEPGQLELFPLEPRGFLAELLRGVHRREGAEGVKLLALLFAHLERTPPGTAVELELADIAAGASLSDLSARGAAQRIRRLERVIVQLGRIELTRVSGRGPQATAQVSRLVTLLSQACAWSPGSDAPPVLHAEQTKPGCGIPARWRVLVDPVFHRPEGTSLGTTFHGLPEFLLEAPGKTHPYLLGLFLFLRAAWIDAQGGAIERTARQLLLEAGLWVSETGRYRALETLKRELETLKAHGCLGAWRVERSAVRDALEDRYRLAPPPSARAVSLPTRRLPETPALEMAVSDAV